MPRRARDGCQVSFINPSADGLHPHCPTKPEKRMADAIRRHVHARSFLREHAGEEGDQGLCGLFAGFQDFVVIEGGGGDACGPVG